MNNKIAEDVFDSVLKHAFEDSFKKELDEYESETYKYSSVTPTKKQKLEAQRAYKVKQRNPKRRYIIVQRIAAAIIIAFSLGSGMMLSAPSVRAAVSDTVIQFFDKYFNFEFSSSSNGIIAGEYTFGYLPDGYIMSESFETEILSSYILSDGTSNIQLKILRSNISDVSVDRENREIQSVDIPNYTAYALTPYDSSMDSVVVWGNARRSFILTSSESITELIKIAKNIK